MRPGGRVRASLRSLGSRMWVRAMMREQPWARRGGMRRRAVADADW